MQFPTIFDLRTGVRMIVSSASALLPQATSVAIERKFRGYEDAKKLEHAKGVVISYGKSGRTWLRVLIWRYYARKHGVACDRISKIDEFRQTNPDIPVLFFTHDNYLKDYVGHDRKIDLYGGSRVVLMVRDPRDTAVSQYFQWKHRIIPRKKIINNYPLVETDLYDFVMNEAAGMPKIIDFLNAWAKDLDRFPNLLLVKYEDLRANTTSELARVLTFFGQEPTKDELDDAAAFASVENMRKMEQENASKLSAHRVLKPGDVSDPSSFKVRRAKVGGWRDYFTDEQLETINAMVKSKLSPVFGYV